MEELFVWQPALALDIEELDAQHKQLFALVNDYHQAIRKNEKKETIEDILSFLAGYAVQHFADEELVMQTKGYPDREEHIGEHVALTDKVKAMSNEINAGNRYNDETLARFLEEWLTTHIMQVDFKLADWLRAN